MNTTLSLLCSLSLSLGWCFSQLTTYTHNMHTRMHMYIYIDKWCGHMKTSEQILIKEMCQGLSHGQKERCGWVHADHLMVQISCGSHTQSLTHAICRVKWGMLKSKCSFQTRAWREVAGMWYNSRPPKNLLWTFYGPDLAPVSHHCGPRAANIIGHFWT